MSRVMKINLFIFLLAMVAFNAEGFAMAKRYTHFVDSNYEGKVIKGQPNGQKGTRWWYEHKDFFVIVNYPADHRAKWPLKQWVTLQVSTTDYPKKKGTYKILGFGLVDDQGKEIPFKFEAKDLGDYRNHEFKTYGMPIAFFTEIPKDVKSLILEFKIEVELTDGQTHIVEESIPLKRAHFEVGLFEKDVYH